MSLTLDEWIYRRINHTVAQLKDAVDAHTSEGDHPVSVAELDADSARRILRAFLRASVRVIADEIEGDYDVNTANDAVSRIRSISDRLLH